MLHTCQRCGKPWHDTAHFARYCRECRKAVYAQMRKDSKRRSRQRRYVPRGTRDFGDPWGKPAEPHDLALKLLGQDRRNY